MTSLRAKALALSLGASSAIAIVATTFIPVAHASVSIAVTFDGLLKETSAAAVVSPEERLSVWENGRIYTYTRAHIDRTVAGDVGATNDEAWIRTMGGVVGDIGQRVDGEAVLTVGRPTLLFLHPGPPGAFEVTARGQGQFPVVLNEKNELRLIRGSNVGMLLPPKSGLTTTSAPITAPPPVLAADVIHGRLVDDVARDVAAAWKRVHAK